MKILNLVLQIIFAPFLLLVKTNAKPSPNKKMNFLLVILISVVLVAILVLIYYHKELFNI